ncbi:MAG: HEAT repeat domain-containing protein [Planctomycetia bacterium]|nr:HEAT repeat domain-containing protein [Planctomycetia bacterium]
MRIPGKSLLALSLYAALALSGSGCTSLDEIHIPFVDPPVDYSFETAADRMGKYRAMGEAASSKPAQEQESQSQQLAEAFGTERDALVRGSIALAAAHYPTAAAKTVLLAAIRDENAETRKAACLAWGRRGGPEGASVLSDVLEAEQDRDVRLVAVRALGEIKDPAAVAVLARGLEDSDVAIQHRAMRSLENVTGKYYGNDVNLWRQYAQGQDVPEQTPSIAERVKRIF